MKKEREKRTGLLMACLTALAAAAVLFLAIGGALRGQGFLKRMGAYQVGERTYSAAEVEWYYHAMYDELLNSTSGYAGLLGLDPDQSLAKQDCPLSEEGESWREYLLGQALAKLSEISARSQEAEAEGRVPEEAARNYAENAMEYWELAALQAGYPELDMYLAEAYGGIRREELYELLEAEYTAEAFEQAYRDSLAFTEEELYDYYTAHEDEFRTYSYLYGFVGEDESAAEMLAAAPDEAAFRAMAREVNGAGCYELRDMEAEEIGGEESADVAWMTDPERKEGDTLRARSGENWYVMYFLGSSAGEEGQLDRVRERLLELRMEEWNHTLAAKYEGRKRWGVRFVGN